MRKGREPGPHRPRPRAPAKVRSVGLPVVCWSRICGSRSLDPSLRDPRKYAVIGSPNWAMRSRGRVLLRGQQTTGSQSPLICGRMKRAGVYNPRLFRSRLRLLESSRLLAAGRRGLLDRLVAAGQHRRREVERAAIELDVAGLRAVLQEALGVLQVAGIAELQRSHALAGVVA
jgi:hypothetical protein